MHALQVSEEEEEEEEAPAVGSQSEGEVVAVAAALWRRMIDLNDKEAKMSHDGGWLDGWIVRVSVHVCVFVHVCVCVHACVCVCVCVCVCGVCNVCNVCSKLPLRLPEAVSAEPSTDHRLRLHPRGRGTRSKFRSKVEGWWHVVMMFPSV